MIATFVWSEYAVHPFPNTQFSDCPKFKEAADDSLNEAIKVF